jgi:hypothetical protein
MTFEAAFYSFISLRVFENKRSIGVVSQHIPELDLYKNRTSYYDVPLGTHGNLNFSLRAIDFGHEYDLYFWGWKSPFTNLENVSEPTAFSVPESHQNRKVNDVVLAREFAFTIIEGHQNDDELLIHKRSEENSYQPVVTSNLQASYSFDGSIIQLVVGRDHAVMSRASSNGDDVVSIGRNEHGQLGTANRELVNRDTWTTIPFFQGNSFADLYAGGGYDDDSDIRGTCFAIQSDRTVLAW